MMNIDPAGRQAGRQLDDRRVILGMSGGVDSSVACFLLQEQGYEVIGLTLLTNPRSYAQLEDVKSICSQAGVSLITADVQADFSRLVIADFIQGYTSGRTPNPCVVCNPAIKFSTLLEAADKEGAAYIATGHYAAISRLPESGRLALTRTDAGLKDQTYFLYRIRQDQLARMLLPLSGQKKTEVRKQAARLNLTGEQGKALAEKPDSQDNCFIPPGGYAAYIRDELEKNGPAEFLKLLEPGPVHNLNGQVIGSHRGLIHYTLGQRKGFSVQTTERLFVVGKNARENILVVGPHQALMRQVIRVVDPVYSGAAGFEPGQALEAKIRNSAPLQPCRVDPQPDGSLQVAFLQPVAAPAPGQSCVFYRENRILAGGYIAD